MMRAFAGKWKDQHLHNGFGQLLPTDHVTASTTCTDALGCPRCAKAHACIRWPKFPLRIREVVARDREDHAWR